MVSLKPLSGFSLVELLVAVGVSSIVLMGTGAIVVDVLKENKREEFEFNRRAFVGTVKNIVFGQSNACAAHFNGVVINVANAANAAGTPISISGLDGVGLNVVLKDATDVPNYNLTVDQVRFSLAKKLGKDIKGRDLYRGSLTVIAHPLKGTSTFYGALPVTDALFAVDNAGLILDCSAAKIEVAQGVCDVSAAGQTCVQYFNPDFVTGICGNPLLITGLGPGENDTVFECNYNFTTKCPGALPSMQKVNGFVAQATCKAFKARYED